MQLALIYFYVNVIGGWLPNFSNGGTKAVKSILLKKGCVLLSAVLAICGVSRRQAAIGVSIFTSLFQRMDRACWVITRQLDLDFRSRPKLQSQNRMFFCRKCCAFDRSINSISFSNEIKVYCTPSCHTGRRTRNADRAFVPAIGRRPSASVNTKSFAYDACCHLANAGEAAHPAGETPSIGAAG